MKVDKIIVFITVFILSLSISGCDKNTSDIIDSSNTVIASQYTLCDSKTTENEKIVYNIFAERVGKYNLNDFSFVAFNTSDNMYQYIFDENHKIFTNGHSINNNFEIDRISETRDEIKNIYTLEDKDNSCIFPLTIDENMEYYLFYENEKKEDEIRSIVKVQNGELSYIVSFSYPQTLIDAIIEHGIIYYTIHNEVNKHYELYKYDLVNNNVELINDNWGGGNIYKYGDSIMYSDGEIITDGKNSYDLGDYNYFDSYYDVLIQVMVIEEQRLVSKVTDLISNDILGTFLEPVDYEITDGVIEVYTLKGIYKLEIDF